MRDKTVPFVPLWEAVHPFNRPLTPHFRLPPTRESAYHDCCATQRYALFLTGFDNIEYKSMTKHCNTDGLSTLPLQQKEREETEVDSSEVLNANQFEPLPVTI